MSALFEPYSLKDVTLRNRIAIPPMCQYMAEDGMVNDWHHVHLAGMARGGACGGPWQGPRQWSSAELRRSWKTIGLSALRGSGFWLCSRQLSSTPHDLARMSMA